MFSIFSMLFDYQSVLGRGFYTLLVLSFVTAPIGCLLVWRRMSYFGSALAHSALLGACFGLFIGIGALAGVFVTNVALALVLGLLLQYRYLASDTLLGMMAHLILAIGLVVNSLYSELRIDIMAYLFGDLLAIGRDAFRALLIGSFLTLCFILFFWRGFLNISVNKEIAMVEGYNVFYLEMLFFVLLALTISLGMQAIGVLLIIAMLLIPAAAARLISSSIKAMIFWAWVINLCASFVGVVFSYYLDTPAGATVVIVSGIIFIILKLVATLKPKLGFA